MRSTRVFWGLAVCAAFLAVAATLAGPRCTAMAADSGEIVLGYDVGITGPYAATTYVMSLAAEDYWKQHNHQVEVDGKTYKIKLIVVDNKGDVSLTVSNFNRFLAEGAVTARTEWTPGGVNLMPLAVKAKVPIVVGGFTKGLFVPPSDYVYLCQPSYAGVLCAGVKWYKENVFKGKGKMKVGLLLWDNAFGRSSHIDEVYDYLTKDLGVEVVDPLFFPLKIKDFTPQLLQMKSKGADLIFMQALAGQYARLAKDAKRMGVKAGLMSTLWCLSDKYIELAGNASNGTYGVWGWNIAPGEDNDANPVIKKLRDCMEKYRGNRYFDVNYFQGWMGQYIFDRALKLAIKKYGFPITGEQLAKTMASMGAWDWGLSNSFSGYAGGDRMGWHEVRVFKVDNGKIVGVSNWLPEPAEFIKRAPWIVGK